MPQRPVIASMMTGSGTSLGTGTAKTLMGGANVILPAWARSILAIRPTATIDVVTAAQSLQVQVDIESNDVQVVPYQVLCPPVDAILGSVGQTYVPEIKKWDMGVPTVGGEQIAVYETALVANTSAPVGNVEIIVSNMPAGFPQQHAKVGTLTSSGTTANSDVAGTRYNFSGAQFINELFGQFAATTVAAADGVAGYLKFTSNEFEVISDARVILQPQGGGLSTTISAMIAALTRNQVLIPVTPGQVNIQDFLNMGIAPGTAGNFVTGVKYQ